MTCHCGFPIRIPEKIEKLFDELDSLTRNTFTALKSDIDSVLADKYRIKPEQLMPWHYQNRFFPGSSCHL